MYVYVYIFDVGRVACNKRDGYSIACIVFVHYTSVGLTGRLRLNVIDVDVEYSSLAQASMSGSIIQFF